MKKKKNPIIINILSVKLIFFWLHMKFFLNKMMALLYLTISLQINVISFCTFSYIRTWIWLGIHWKNASHRIYLIRMLVYQFQIQALNILCKWYLSKCISKLAPLMGHGYPNINNSLQKWNSIYMYIIMFAMFCHKFKNC